MFLFFRLLLILTLMFLIFLGRKKISCSFEPVELVVKVACCGQYLWITFFCYPPGLSISQKRRSFDVFSNDCPQIHRLGGLGDEIPQLKNKVKKHFKGFFAFYVFLRKSLKNDFKAILALLKKS